MHTSQVLAPGQEKPRRALRLARYALGDDYDEEALPAEVICFFYFVILPILVVGGATAIGGLLYLYGRPILNLIGVL